MRDFSSSSPSSSLAPKGRVFRAGNVIPHEWHDRFRDKNGETDLVAITLLADIVAWRRNGTNDYYGENAPKLKGKEVSMPYSYFEDRFTFKPQKARRAFVRLEEFGVLTRCVRNIKLLSGQRINRIFITLDDEFFESCFVDPDTDLRITKNDADNSGGINSGCGQTLPSFELSDHHETDHLSNKNLRIKDRSTESNFCKISDFKAEITSKPFKSKELKDFYPLSAADCSLLQSASKRDFSLNFMNELLLDMSKRLSNRCFNSKKGFLSYMTKALANEKRNAISVNNIDFRIKANRSEAEVKEVEIEQYLSKIEYSLEVSPAMHLKKKLAAVLLPSKAYELLKNYSGVSRVGRVFNLHLSKDVELTANEKLIILNQVKATHQNIDFECDNLGFIEELKFVVKAKHNKVLVHNRSQKTELPAGIWGDIRRKLTNLYSEHVDRNWFSKLEAVIDESNKQITLKAQSNFIRDWIEINYRASIERICGHESLTLIGVGV